MGKDAASQPENVEMPVVIPTLGSVALPKESEPSAGQGKINYALIQDQTKSLVIAGNLPRLTLQDSDSSRSKPNATTAESDATTAKFGAIAARPDAISAKTDATCTTDATASKHASAHTRVRAEQRKFYGW
jgi:hypothetical protein